MTRKYKNINHRIKSWDEGDNSGFEFTAQNGDLLLVQEIQDGDLVIEATGSVTLKSGDTKDIVLDASTTGQVVIDGYRFPDTPDSMYGQVMASDGQGQLFFSTLQDLGAQSIYLNQAVDVELTDLQDSQVLQYDESIQKWKNVFAGNTTVIPWGQITGSISDQEDLQTALDNKLNVGTTTVNGEVRFDEATLTLGGDGVTNPQFQIAKDDTIDRYYWLMGLDKNSNVVGNYVHKDYDYAINGIKYPKIDGDANQVLATDGFGQLFFKDDLEGDEAVWGNLTGTLSDQTDLQTELDNKSNTGHNHTKSEITDFNDADYATTAQGALADSALQSGNNISLLTNDVGYITASEVPEAAVWGNITGTLSDQTDLQTALDAKLNTVDAFSGSYDDLTNVPTEFNPETHSHITSEITDIDDLELNGGEYTGEDAGAYLNYLLSVFEDKTPVLGGDLDTNGNNLMASSGDLLLNNLAFPDSDGSENQVLTTNGAGQLLFRTVSGGGVSAVDSVDGRTGAVSLTDLYSPIVHTHTEADITDLDKYTQAEVDAAVNAKAQAGDNVSIFTNDAGYITAGEVPATGLQVVEDDTAPVLGGNLDIKDFLIYNSDDLGSVSIKSPIGIHHPDTNFNQMVIAANNGGNFIYSNDKNFNIYAGGAGNSLKLSGDDLELNQYIFPKYDAPQASGQVLTTDGAGNLSFTDLPTQPTAEEIKTAYESNADTNPYTDADKAAVDLTKDLGTFTGSTIFDNSDLKTVLQALEDSAEIPRTFNADVTVREDLQDVLDSEITIEHGTVIPNGTLSNKYATEGGRTIGLEYILSGGVEFRLAYNPPTSFPIPSLWGGDVEYDPTPDSGATYADINLVGLSAGAKVTVSYYLQRSTSNTPRECIIIRDPLGDHEEMFNEIGTSTRTLKEITFIAQSDIETIRIALTRTIISELTVNAVGTFSSSSLIDNRDVHLNDPQENDVLSYTANGLWENVPSSSISTINNVNAGTTAERPSDPRLGEVYYDTTINRIIFYTKSGWVAVLTQKV